jgi:hypothetical protein
LSAVRINTELFYKAPKRQDTRVDMELFCKAPKGRTTRVNTDVNYKAPLGLRDVPCTAFGWMMGSCREDFASPEGAG